MTLIVILCVCSAMDARQFHHQHHTPVTSFDDVMDLCVDDDVMKQEPPGVSLQQPRVSPPVTTTAGVTAVDGDDHQGFVSYRLDPDDSGGSSTSSGVQPVIFDPDPDVAAAADLCLPDSLRLPCMPAKRANASSPSELDMCPPLAARQGSGCNVLRPSPGLCKVCGDEATGMYFGALVCVPCKVIWFYTASLNSLIPSAVLLSA